MRMLSLGLVVTAVFLAPGAVFLACGGSTGSTVGDGGADGPIDSTTQDTGLNNDGGGDSAIDTNLPDLGTPEMGPTACAAMPRAMCIACCGQQDRDGAVALFKDLAACACAPDVCGPLEGGAPEGGAADGGVGFGMGDCTEAECNGTAFPMGRCLRCDLRSIDPDAGGPCTQTVIGECVSDPACLAYAQCTGSCPK